MPQVSNKAIKLDNLLNLIYTYQNQKFTCGAFVLDKTNAMSFGESVVWRLSPCLKIELVSCRR